MKRKQQGFGALEVMICLIIGAFAAVAGARIYQNIADRQLNTVAAQQLSEVSDAASKYQKDNYAAITSVATATTPATITLAMLRATGYLPASYSDTNVYGQSYSILALEPTANKLQTLIVTQGGDTIKEMSLYDIAKQTGSRGGYISSASPTVATGSFIGWQLALSSYGVTPGAGHLASALFFGDAAIVADYLYRNSVPGHPEVNTMNTAINANNNNINNINTVNTVTANVSGNTSTSGETYTGGWFRSRNDGMLYNEKWGSGFYMNDPSWVRIYNDKGLATAGTLVGGQVVAFGNMTATGRIQTNEYVYFNGQATAGTGCSPNGLEGSDSTGAALRCVNGSWQSSGGGVNNYTAAWWATGDTGAQGNWSGRTQFIQVSQDVGSRDCDIEGYVQGNLVAQNRNDEGQWLTACFISFMVPPGQVWQATAHRFLNTSTKQPGNILIWVYTL